jgi:D-sorbitol dehydrogenase (acceptor)
MQLENKVAIVTGGAHGIGLAIAGRYVAEGAKVVIADVDAAAGEAAVTDIDARRCSFVRTDVGDKAKADCLVGETCSLFGGLTSWSTTPVSSTAPASSASTRRISTACCAPT